MPGFLDLEATARRLSFSTSPSPSPPRAARSCRKRGALAPIAEDDPAEQASARTPAVPSTCAPPPSRPLYPPTDERRVMGYAPPATPMFQPSPAPSVSPFQPQEEASAAAAAALRELKRGCEATLVAEAALRQIQQQAWAAEAVRPQPQQLRLYTVEGLSAGYTTKWEELHPVSQHLLLQIEDKIREYRHESDLLDQCSRLYDPSVNNKSFELDASQIMQEIGWTSTVMDREKSSIQSLIAVVKEVMWDTDCAIRSYVKFRPRFIHSGIANAGFANRAGWSGAPTDFHQPLTTAPTFHYCSGAATRPSPFMQQTVARFENHFEDCSRLVAELEQLVHMKNAKNHSNSLESLSKVMSNVHDYFIHVASKVEDLRQYAETMRTQYLNDRKRRGDWSYPFLEADRREAAKQEAVAKRVHPTLHCNLQSRQQHQLDTHSHRSLVRPEAVVHLNVKL